MSAPLGPGDPRRLGEYDLVRRLGEGGQGTVYLGIGPDGGKVAVKVLKGHTDPATQRRLAREFEVLKRVNPFCTARLISYEDGHIVSEYVDGPSLQERVQAQGALRGGELVRLAIGTASALAAIHDAGVVHRDFKPANVLLGPDGPRVVDFGIARPLDAGSSVTASVGTPGYLAPELLRGESVTAASDLFSWAATIVYAATGAHPFGAESVALIYQRILTHEPDLSAVPPELLPLVRACLAKDPAARPDAHDVLVGLVSPQTAGRLREPTVPVPERGPRGRRPSRTAWTAGGAGLLAVLLVAAFLLWPRSGDKPDEKGSAAITGPSSTGTASPTVTAPSTGVPPAYAGSWSGTARSNDPADPNPTEITLTLTAGTAEATWRDGGGCVQPMRYLRDEGGSILFQHVATGCSGGTITLTPSGDVLGYLWSDGQGLTYSGDLTR
ncbi:protein kinase domain-containing protein [Actinocorallia aurantiaca]|uniref:non-specific serine/threonine protein kinase n=1 Tax=Actinocorallia aurantiaca TaxID=46204 RepID=A0ABP6GRZ0_9ACTN